MPVFLSTSEEKVAQGRRMVVANTIRHLVSDCTILAKTGEAGGEYAKNVHRAPRNTAKLRAATTPCSACFGQLGATTRGETGAREARVGWASDVNPESIPDTVKAHVSANATAWKTRRDAQKRTTKDAKKAAKSTGNKRAQSAAAKAKAARKRSGKKPAAQPATAAPTAAAPAETQEAAVATA